jgi:hypothetical protein
MLSKKPPRPKGGRSKRPVTAPKQRQPGESRDDTAFIASELSRIEALDRAGRLNRRRSEFLVLLDDARKNDHSTITRRARAKALTRTASALEDQAKRIERAHSEYAHAIRDAARQLRNGVEFVSLDRSDTLGLRKVAAHSSSWVAELKDRARIHRQAAAWYGDKATQRSDQWGPATQQAVTTIIEQVDRRIRQENWSRESKPKQHAECYAGLLCLHAGPFAMPRPSRTLFANVWSVESLGCGRRRPQPAPRRRSTCLTAFRVAPLSTAQFCSPSCLTDSADAR